MVEDFGGDAEAIIDSKGDGNEVLFEDIAVMIPFSQESELYSIPSISSNAITTTAVTQFECLAAELETKKSSNKMLEKEVQKLKSEKKTLKAYALKLKDENDELLKRLDLEAHEKQLIIFDRQRLEDLLKQTEAAAAAATAAASRTFSSLSVQVDGDEMVESSLKLSNADGGHWSTPESGFENMPSNGNSGDHRPDTESVSTHNFLDGMLPKPLTSPSNFDTEGSKRDLSSRNGIFGGSLRAVALLSTSMMKMSTGDNADVLPNEGGASLTTSKGQEHIVFEAVVEKTRDLGLGLDVYVDPEYKELRVHELAPFIKIHLITPTSGGSIVAGDTIIAIDKDCCIGWSIAQVRQRLNNTHVPEGSTVRVKFRRRPNDKYLPNRKGDGAAMNWKSSSWYSSSFLNTPRQQIDEADNEIGAAAIVCSQQCLDVVKHLQPGEGHCGERSGAFGECGEAKVSISHDSDKIVSNNNSIDASVTFIGGPVKTVWNLVGR